MDNINKTIVEVLSEATLTLTRTGDGAWDDADSGTLP